MCVGKVYFDGLVQDCNKSSALAMELSESYTKPSICSILLDFVDIYFPFSFCGEVCVTEMNHHKFAYLNQGYF